MGHEAIQGCSYARDACLEHQMKAMYGQEARRRKAKSVVGP